MNQLFMNLFPNDWCSARGWPRGFVPTLELSSQKKEREGKTGQVGLFALPYLFLFPCLPACLPSLSPEKERRNVLQPANSQFHDRFSPILVFAPNE